MNSQVRLEGKLGETRNIEIDKKEDFVLNDFVEVWFSIEATGAVHLYN